jgi:hypothetical protein
LRLSRIDKLNDPFELIFDVDKNSAQFNFRAKYKENANILLTWKEYLDNRKIVYNKDSFEEVLHKFIHFKTIDFRESLKVLKENWNQNLGIICMSEAMDVIQMWAHYADKHKGIVVGIEENEFVNDRNFLITVCYRDKMVLFPLPDTEQELDQYGEKYLPEVLARKETNWFYEKEIRIFGKLEEVDKDGHYYLNVPTSAIKEIYLGLKSDDTLKMIALCLKKKPEYRHLKVFKMHRHENSFKLNPQEVSN